MTCRHPRSARTAVTRTSHTCSACGLVNAMVAGRSGCYRRWLQPEDPRVAQGKVTTEALLESARLGVLP